MSATLFQFRLGRLVPVVASARRWLARAERRSTLLASIALAVVLLINIPLFLHMPLWADATFYDVCARNIIRGGAHYADSFDGNLPGPVWLHLAIRSLFGWSAPALRAVDLGILAVGLAVLTTWPMGMSRAGRVWLLVGLCAAYFSLAEYSHCQRDVWMASVCLCALALRSRQTLRLNDSAARSGGICLAGVAEGLVWGAAVWIKPHVVVPALLTWLASIRLGFRGPDTWRRCRADAAGLLLGGLIAGGVGLVGLYHTGSFAAFFDVLLGWNWDYLPRESLRERFERFFVSFGFWSKLHFVALPSAVYLLVRRRETTPSTDRAALLAALYLGWVAQAVILQHGFEYHYTPPLLLAVALLACSGIFRFGWARGCAAGFLALVLSTHPMFWPTRIACWPECVSRAHGSELEDRLRLVPTSARAYSRNQCDLDRVAHYLRSQDLKDGELTCYDWRTISLYLDLDVKPSTRFLMLDVDRRYYPHHHRSIDAAVRASRQRFVVTDFTSEIGVADAASVGPEGPLSLPPKFPTHIRGEFPWCEPIVFRFGQYAVHSVSGGRERLRACSSPPGDWETPRVGP